MSEYVVIRDMSAGNDSVGEMWQETKVFSGDTTLEQVMCWAMEVVPGKPMPHMRYSRKRITITKPHQKEGSDASTETVSKTEDSK